VTMLDDDRLASLFARAGEAFDVPVTGPADILERAAGRTAPAVDDDHGPPPRGRVRRLAGRASRHRVLSVAACVVVLVALAGTIGALVRGPARPTLTTAAARPGSSHAPATPKPVPALSSRGLAAPDAKAAAPFAGGASGAASGATTTTTPENAPSNVAFGADQSPKIQQTGSLTLTVGRGKLSGAVTQLTALAATYGGYVANSQTQSGAAPSGSVTLQVPVQSFAAVLTRAEALGRTSDVTTKATNVTGQYVDLQARITALQASRQQYLTILAEATTVGDVLAVQEQIDSLQSQIEQLQGQLQLLTSQTSYSTVHITLGERAPAPAPGPLPESGLVRAWHTSIGGFVAGVEGLVRIAGPLLFALLLSGVALAGGRALWRRYQRHNL
jgi:hypothetical protein